MNPSIRNTALSSVSGTPTDMRCIINASRDPALSLAAEEFLLTEKTDGDWLMLWISDPSIIVGKFQNVFGEVSVTECEKAIVPVYRRNSGGGTVYLRFEIQRQQVESERIYREECRSLLIFVS